MRILIIILIIFTSCSSKTDMNLDSSRAYLSKNHNNNNKTNNMDTQTIYDFTKEGKGKWRIQNDVVMGGHSESQLKLTEDSKAHFSGRVSLENNGGFCSIHQTSEKSPYTINSDHSAFILMLKGDGKDYNFRVRTPKGRHSYAYTFSTEKGENFEKITIPFNKMAATYRGEKVDVSNYQGENIVEMQLLIGNKKEESFEIILESISVK